MNKKFTTITMTQTDDGTIGYIIISAASDSAELKINGTTGHAKPFRKQEVN